MKCEIFSINARIISNTHIINIRLIVKVIDLETDKISMELPPREYENNSTTVHIFAGMMMDRLC